jgi:hypothetical protein
MNWISRLALLASPLAIAVFSTADAQPLAVANHSFEEPETNRTGVPNVPGWTQQENAPRRRLQLRRLAAERAGRLPRVEAPAQEITFPLLTI